MTYTEFRRHLGKAGLTVNAFAQYLGVRPSSVSNYAQSCEVPRTYAMLSVLMGDLVDQGKNVEDLLQRFDIFPIATTSKSQTNVRQIDMFRIAERNNRTKVSAKLKAIAKTPQLDMQEIKYAEGDKL